MNLDTAPATETCPPLIGVAALTRRCHDGENLVPLGQYLLSRAQENPLDANAHLDLSTVLLLTGHRRHALAVQTEAIRLQALYTLPARFPGLRLLALKGPGDLMANTPVEFLLEDADIELQLLYLLPDDEWPQTVPDHDVMMVAVGESDANQPLLGRLAGYVGEWPRPVINRPERIASLSRDSVCTLLQGAPGIEIPVTARISRGELQALARGERALASLLPDGGFPIIVRPLGSHAGTHLESLMTAADIPAYLEQVPAAGFYIARFVDYRSSDGLFRKYRIALIEGKPYVCHFAVSEHWIIHYANAGMRESAAKRAEEARIMETFDSDFAVRHGTALQSIHQRMGLPYLGVDCAETRSGELLIFEVDNAMVVHGLDAEAVFPYKKPAMQKVFGAFRQMLENARHGTPGG